MSFETYQALQDEIRSFLWDREDIAAKIPSFISLAEAEMRRLIRTRESTAMRPFSLGGEIASIPCGAGTIKAVRINSGSSTKDLDYIPPEEYSSLSHDLSGLPRFYTIQNEQLYFHPAGPSQGEIVFVEAFEPLSNFCRSNWLLKKHPDVYLCGALKWGKAWLIDGDWDWSGPFYAAIEAANADNPRVQTNTSLRADEVTRISRNAGGYNILTDGGGGYGYIEPPTRNVPVEHQSNMAADFLGLYESVIN